MGVSLAVAPRTHATANMRFLLLLAIAALGANASSTTTAGLFVKVTETSTAAVTETFTPYCVVSVGSTCSTSKKRRRRAAVLAALPDGFDDVTYNALHDRVRRSVTQPEALESSQQAAGEEKQGRIGLFTLAYTTYTTTTQYVVTDTQTISASPSCDLTDLAVPTCGTAYTVSTYTATTYTSSTTSTTTTTSYVSSAVPISLVTYTGTTTYTLSKVT